MNDCRHKILELVEKLEKLEDAQQQIKQESKYAKILFDTTVGLLEECRKENRRLRGCLEKLHVLLSKISEVYGLDDVSDWIEEALKLTSSGSAISETVSSQLPQLSVGETGMEVGSREPSGKKGNKPLKDKNFKGSIFEKLGFDADLCPVCGAHLRNGICLNGCHLNPSAKERFHKLMEKVAEKRGKRKIEYLGDKNPQSPP